MKNNICSFFFFFNAFLVWEREKIKVGGVAFRCLSSPAGEMARGVCTKVSVQDCIPSWVERTEAPGVVHQGPGDSVKGPGSAQTAQ